MCENYVCEECSKIKDIECAETNKEWPKINHDKCKWEFYYNKNILGGNLKK
jgi:acetone carboxylase gamma subunit